jgi:hypothetical protein
MMAHVDVAELVSSPQFNDVVSDVLRSLGGTSRGSGLDEVLRRAGIEPAKDIRDVCVCVNNIAGAGESSITYAVAGDFEPHTLLPALRSSDLGFEELQEGGVSTMRGGGVVIAQASDGTIVLSFSDSQAREALEGKSTALADAELPLEPTLSFLARGPAFREMMSNPPDNSSPFRYGSSLERIEIVVDLPTSTAEWRLTMANREATLGMGEDMTLFMAKVREKQEAFSVIAKHTTLKLEDEDVVLTTNRATALMKAVISGGIEGARRR